MLPIGNMELEIHLKIKFREYLLIEVIIEIRIHKERLIDFL